LTFGSQWGNILLASSFSGVPMKYTVTYEDGVWVFSLESTDPASDYYEEWEITDENDAKAIALELIQEICEAMDDEDLEDLGNSLMPRS